MVNMIPDTLSSMGFGVEINKLHFRSCSHHVNYVLEINIMEGCD